MISKGSHLVVIIRIVSTGLHDCNITHSSIRLIMNRKNLLKKLCSRASVLISCILNLIEGSLCSINPLLLSLFRFLVDILRPEFDVVGRLPDPSDIQFYFRARMFLLCEFVQCSSNI